MAFIYDEFILAYPEFGEIAVNAVSNVGDREDMILSDTAWGNLRCHALYLRTAHRLALRFNIGKIYKTLGMKNGASSAITTSKSASNASLSESSELNAFARSENPLWADFGRTEYGLEYLRLLEEIMPEGNVILSRSVGDVLY